MSATIEEINADIKNLKKERKEIKEIYGKYSVEYAELTEEIDSLKDSRSFAELHY